MYGMNYSGKDAEAFMYVHLIRNVCIILLIIGSLSIKVKWIKRESATTSILEIIPIKSSKMKIKSFFTCHAFLFDSRL